METIWRMLRSNRAAHTGRRILSLFDDPQRFKDFSIKADDMLLDYAKTSIDREARELLLKLAEAAGVESRRDAMFAGEKINISENRAVLHTALRAKDGPVMVDGQDVMPDVKNTLARMAGFANALRNGKIKAADGGPITEVISIGIGGSDLGPAMGVKALGAYHDGPKVRFVSNIDGAHFAEASKRADPARTLVIVASKTFTTIETMTNAETARRWLGAGAASQMVAISSAPDKTAEFGIPSERVFGFADWVGGRYSVWGPIGLPVMLAVGPERFFEFLEGGRAMDQHFCHAPMAENMPVMLALTGIWHRNICDYPTRAVLPYDQRLSRLPAYLQQLDMESNGKSVTLSDAPVNQLTGPVVWGQAGTNGQHAFYQLLHQGTNVIPCEFMIAAKGSEPELAHHHDLLKANCLAQSEALMRGRVSRNLRPYRKFPGNRPSVTLAYPQLTPFVLGQIIALYEHRVFVEGVIWGINSFDQWGVELGKEMATALVPLVKGADAAGKDGSTQGLLKALDAG
ncbi:MAG: glucose-6-phosphate isomerase [Rhodobacteraceae bacterium]|nr:glucose-6-phosphate isomerase [Paracoccaceae bacterium]